jgi:hypothetical protein
MSVLFGFWGGFLGSSDTVFAGTVDEEIATALFGPCCLLNDTCYLYKLLGVA